MHAAYWIPLISSVLCVVLLEIQVCTREGLNYRMQCHYYCTISTAVYFSSYRTPKNTAEVGSAVL